MKYQLKQMLWDIISNCYLLNYLPSRLSVKILFFSSSYFHQEIIHIRKLGLLKIKIPIFFFFFRNITSLLVFIGTLNFRSTFFFFVFIVLSNTSYEDESISNQPNLFPV